MNKSLLVVALGMALMPASASAQETRPVLSPANAGEITEVARLGNGSSSEFALSPDDQTVAVITSVGVALHDTANLGVPPRRILPGGATRVKALAYSPDGQILVFGDYDGVVRLVDTTTDEVAKTFDLDSAINDFAFHPTQPELLVIASGDAARVWNTTTGEQVAALEGNSVSAVTFSADGTRLITGGSGEVIIWDNFQQISTSSAQNVIYDLAINPQNANQLAYALHEVSGFVTQEGNDRFVEEFSADNARSTAVAYNPDGTLLVEAWSNDNVFVRDTVSGDIVHQLEHPDYVMDAQFNADGTQVWASAGDNHIYVWDAASGELLNQFAAANGEMIAAAFSPDGTAVAAAGRDGATVYLWDTATLQEIAWLFDGRESYSIAFSLDNQYLATGGTGDFSVHVWQAGDATPSLVLSGHTEVVNSVAFSPDSHRLASGSSDETVRVWDMPTGDLVYTITDVPDRVLSVIFSPDGTTLLVSSVDGAVRLYNAPDGALLSDFTPDVDRPCTLAVNADGTSLVIGGFNTARSYNTTPGQSVDPVPAYVSISGRRAVFNPDGSLFAAALENFSRSNPDVVLVDMRDNPGAQVEVETFLSNALAFSPDGTLLASAGKDGFLYLLGVSTPQEPAATLTLAAALDYTPC